MSLWVPGGETCHGQVALGPVLCEADRRVPSGAGPAGGAWRGPRQGPRVMEAAFIPA